MEEQNTISREYARLQRRRGRFIVLILAVLLVLSTAAIFLGTSDISLPGLLALWFPNINAAPITRTQQVIIVTLRLPRIVTALLVGAGDWSDLFECGKCELTFTLFDPVSYGDSRIERTASFGIGGTWPTFPEFRLVAAQGDAIQVYYPAAGKGVRIEQGFAGGETVVIDCASSAVLVNDADARDAVTLGSDFFALEAGACSLEFSGCTYYETRFPERWV